MFHVSLLRLYRVLCSVCVLLYQLGLFVWAIVPWFPDWLLCALTGSTIFSFKHQYHYNPHRQEERQTEEITDML